jgi:hypothetical protein
MLPQDRRLPGALALIEGGAYFIVRGPSRTGKTTALSALARDLTAGGRHVALRLPYDEGPIAGGGSGAAEQVVLDAIRQAAREQRFPREWMPPDPWPTGPLGKRIVRGLRDWAVKCPLPLVLLFDVDGIGAIWGGASSTAMMGQLRDGFSDRPDAFPCSIVLWGPGAFSPELESIGVGNFTLDDVQALYGQHTEETGQQFTEEAVNRAFGYTQGQPWLVNHLARDIIDHVGAEPAVPITAGHVDAAKERLILSLAPDLASTAGQLNDSYARRILKPLIAGRLSEEDDHAFVPFLRYFGVVAADSPIRVANPIYREAIVQILDALPEEPITAAPPSLVLPDGRLDLPRLMDEYLTAMDRTPGGSRSYGEFFFMHQLRRMLNDDGHFDPHPIGSGRIHVLVHKSHGTDQLKHVAVESKVWRKGRPDPLPAGLKQLDRYLHRQGLDTGILVIFDSRPEAAPVRERSSITAVHGPSGGEITVLRA